MRMFSAVFASLLALMFSGLANAESGRVGNKLNVTVTYFAGTRGPDGSVVNWTEHTLKPCEIQEWSADLREGEAGIPMTWPLWTDHRKDENGAVISTGNQIALNADGTALSVFFAYGDQVWLDSSAAASMEGCIAPPAAESPATPSPEQPQKR